jgi:hypothetical protein
LFAASNAFIPDFFSLLTNAALLNALNQVRWVLRLIASARNFRRLDEAPSAFIQSAISFVHLDPAK